MSLLSLFLLLGDDFVLAVLHLLDEALGGFEAGDIVCINLQGGIGLDIAGCLGSSVLDVEASKATKIHIFLLVEQC